MANVLGYGLEVGEFNLQLCYHVHVWTYAPYERREPLYLPAMG